MTATWIVRGPGEDNGRAPRRHHLNAQDKAASCDRQMSGSLAGKSRHYSAVTQTTGSEDRRYARAIYRSPIQCYTRYTRSSPSYRDPFVRDNFMSNSCIPRNATFYLSRQHENRGNSGFQSAAINIKYGTSRHLSHNWNYIPWRSSRILIPLCSFTLTVDNNVMMN